MFSCVSGGLFMFRDVAEISTFFFHGKTGVPVDLKFEVPGAGMVIRKQFTKPRLQRLCYNFIHSFARAVLTRVFCINVARCVV